MFNLEMCTRLTCKCAQVSVVIVQCAMCILDMCKLLFCQLRIVQWVRSNCVILVITLFVHYLYYVIIKKELCGITWAIQCEHSLAAHQEKSAGSKVNLCTSDLAINIKR